MSHQTLEIRFRIDRQERAQFEEVARRVGMNTNEMVKVFIRRAIAAGGFPFEMRTAGDEVAPAERVMPVHGVSVAYISTVASRAAEAAHAEHVKAGRLQPSTSEPHARADRER